MRTYAVIGYDRVFKAKLFEWLDTSSVKDLADSEWANVKGVSPQDLSAGGYWISGRGRIFKVQTTHHDSLLKLPTELFEQMTKMCDSQISKNNLREIFILRTGWLRLRIHDLHDSGRQGWLIDYTEPMKLTALQYAVLNQVKSRINTESNMTKVTANGQPVIAAGEMTPFRKTMAQLEEPQIQTNFFDPTIFPSDPALLATIKRMKRTGD
jgi:hypothetical protein